MSGFIQHAACRRRRPAHLGQPLSTLRPGIVARLLRERKVPRFIFAPRGYGKTSVASEYCETVFSFDHVFWIKATSPCFLRDLDKRSIASDVQAVDEEASLVVFDDVPLLDGERARLFAEQLERLLERGCEVLVCGVPSASVCSQLLEECLVLRAADLLLDDDELKTADPAWERAAHSDSPIPVLMRVPAVAWGPGRDSFADLVADALSSDVPDALSSALAYMALAGSGSVRDVATVFADAGGNRGGDALAKDDLEGTLVSCVHSNWPHFGIDDDGLVFDCSVLSVVDAAWGLRRWLRTSADEGSRQERVALLRSWIEDLCERGPSQAERACDAVRLLLPVDQRGPWAAGRGFLLIRFGCLLACSSLLHATGKTEACLKMRLGVYDAVCRLLLGDCDAALGAAKRIAFSKEGPLASRLVCSALAVRHGQKSLSGKAYDSLAHLVDACADDESGAVAASGADDADSVEGALVFARGALAWVHGSADLGYYLSSLLRAGAGLRGGKIRDALCVLSSWLMDALADERKGRRDGEAPVVAPALVEVFVRAQLHECEGARPDTFAAAAGLATERAHAAGVMFGEGPLPAGAMMSLRQAELSVMSQRIRYEAEERSRREIQAARLRTHPDMVYTLGNPDQVSDASKRTPLLSVRLFGKMELHLGDRKISEREFHRQKVRRLFLLLVINRGRELPRDTVCEHLWPTSRLDVSRRNYYTVYSELRRLLTLPDGTCPYIVSHRMGCSLDDDHVSTDLARLDEICREFLFGEPDEDSWGALYREVDRDFRDDLLPSEVSDEYVAQTRTDMRQRLVDALTVGSQRITQFGYPQRGIWFARSAIAHDRTREDAHMALMNAQMAANQRTAAMMTFMDMRRILSEDLGIDPSPEAVSLYDQLLAGGDERATAAC